MKKPVNRHEPEVFMRRRKCQACKGYLQYPAYPDPADPEVL